VERRGEQRRKMGNEEKEEMTGGRVMGLKEGGRGRSGSTRVLEMWKRKRDLEEGADGKIGREEGEVFQKSKKTVRSPIGKVVEREMKIMGSIKRWMEEMMGKWDKMEERMEERMEGRMKSIMEELEEMKRREEE